jgi:catechol 2,3-dioxygenase-like lactoylglutathione lyase family enzyme
VFGRFDHAGLIVSDLEGTVARTRESLGLPVARTSQVESYGLDAVFLGEGNGTLEIFTFSDPEILGPRLDGAETRLDHLAFEVDDLVGLSKTLAATGVRFSGPDRVGEITEPIAFGPVLNLWILPETAGGVAIQLLERTAQ